MVVISKSSSLPVMVIQYKNGVHLLEYTRPTWTVGDSPMISTLETGLTLLWPQYSCVRHFNLTHWNGRLRLVYCLIEATILFAHILFLSHP